MGAAFRQGIPRRAISINEIYETHGVGVRCQHERAHAPKHVCVCRKDALIRSIHNRDHGGRARHPWGAACAPRLCGLLSTTD